MTPPRLGLALGSGVARGWAHIGVLRALSRAGIVPDVICGTSIGALAGGLYLVGELPRLEEWALSLKQNGILRYLDLQITGGGLISGRRLHKLLNDTLGDRTIESLPHPFAAVTTELGTGHEIWVQSGKLIDAVIASYSLPGLFPPRKVQGRWLIDGALTNPVPVSVCRALGARLVIAVNLNADVFGLSAPPDSDDFEMLQGESNGRFLSSPLNMMKHQFFGHTRNSPSLFGVMVSALNIVQDRLSRSRLAGDPPDVMIAPRLAHFGLLEFDKAEEMISEGERAVDDALPFINRALQVLG